MYINDPAALDDFIVSSNKEHAIKSMANTRGRMNTRGWGGMFYRYRTTMAKDEIREYEQIAK